MKESYWGYWFIILGVFIIGIMMFTQDATTSTTQDMGGSDLDIPTFLRRKNK